MDQNKRNRIPEVPAGSRKGTSMTIIGGGHMDPLEVGAAHQAMPQGIIEHGAQKVEQV